jgi:hypothetical protein
MRPRMDVRVGVCCVRALFEVLKRRTGRGAQNRRGTDCPLGRRTSPGTSLAVRYPGTANTVGMGSEVLRLAPARQGHQLDDAVPGQELGACAAAQMGCASGRLRSEVGAMPASRNGLAADSGDQGCEHQHHRDGERSSHTRGNDGGVGGRKVDRS